MSYEDEDDHMAIYHRTFSLVHFLVSGITLAFIFNGLKYYFNANNAIWRHFIKRQVQVEDGLQKYIWDRKTAVKEAKYDK